MDVTKPIYWHQGLFLQPQHFQLNDMHARFRLRPFLETGLPYFWGIGKLQISESALAKGVFDVQMAHLLFRDGACTYLEFPGNTVIKARSFESVWKDRNKPFRIYFALKKLSLVESNVVVVQNLQEGAEINTRCLSTNDTEEIPDLHTGGPCAEIKTLQFVVRVLWESELDKFPDYETMPVAQLEYGGEDIRLSGHFIPPCYAISGAPVLYNTIKEIYNNISARAHQLEQYKNPREIRRSEFDMTHMSSLLALRTLNRYTALLHHYLELPQSHPWHIYGILRQLIGELSSFSDYCNMLGEFKDGQRSLPTYDHTDLGLCLLMAQNLILQLLNEISVGPELSALFTLRDNHFYADLQASFFNPRHRYYLILRSEINPSIFMDSFLASAKLATVIDLPMCVRCALPGIEFSHAPVTPQGLPHRAYSFYFRLETTSQAWRQVEQDNNLALDWPDAPGDLKVELVVLPQ